MFLSTHSAAGMLLGAVIPNPPGAFIAGVAAHVVLDMIPHEPEKDLILSYPADGKHSRETVLRRIVISTVDLSVALAIIVLSWFFSRTGSSQPGTFVAMTAGIAGSLLPDCIIMLTFFRDNRFLRWFFDVHNRIHFVISRVSVPRTVSVVYQVLLSCIMVLITYAIVV